MRRTPLTAMLTLLAVLASTFAVAGCGGNSSPSALDTVDEQRRRRRTTTTHKHKTKPAY